MERNKVVGTEREDSGRRSVAYEVAYEVDGRFPIMQLRNKGNNVAKNNKRNKVE